MESNIPQDSTALALQIQTLLANIGELTRQNQEMRQQLQQKENWSSTRIKTNRSKDEALGLQNSHRRDGSRRKKPSDRASNNLLKSMKKRRWTN